MIGRGWSVDYMKFVFLFLGKTRNKYLDMGIQDYANRLQRFVKTEFIVIKDKHENRAPDEIVKSRDADLLLQHSHSASFRVALDPQGKQLDSVELAALLSDWENRGVRTVHFIIGGHLGLHERVLRQADCVLSLSRLTFTHEMTRLILLEQLYRGCMIQTGRKYHN